MSLQKRRMDPMCDEKKIMDDVKESVEELDKAAEEAAEAVSDAVEETADKTADKTARCRPMMRPPGSASTAAKSTWMPKGTALIPTDPLRSPAERRWWKDLQAWATAASMSEKAVKR